MKILYIHGAGASPLSFKYISEHIDIPALFMEYNLQNSLSENIILTKDFIKDEKDIICIGHSMGGLIAAGIKNCNSVKKIITISAPLGGVSGSTMLALFYPRTSIFKDLISYGPSLSSIRKNSESVNKPHIAIVSTHGFDFISHQNDCVVSVASQMAWQTPEYHKINLNHFEVLMSDETIAIIKKVLNLK